MKFLILENLTGRQRSLLSGAAAAAGLLLWIGGVVLPLQRARGELHPKVQVLEGAVRQAAERAAQLPAIREELERLSSAGTELPAPSDRSAQEQLPALLEGLSRMARESGVTIQSVRPLADPAILEPAASGALELPLEVRLSSGYHALGAFVARVEGSEAFLIRVERLEIWGEASDIWNHPARLEFRAFLAPTEKP
ncbi:MAG: hypothetical protein COV76_03380 [Candidatus Omnitrophica bacterium CG11_big_fil_rev_8_21_14_0_20_64_10]|nr:MAG: hypothetical protein COV76_03380 [Candidatus Omnitrophica bacterium CG11_big_fil_rev_8_21_14_0_20_64_10]